MANPKSIEELRQDVKDAINSGAPDTGRYQAIQSTQEALIRRLDFELQEQHETMKRLNRTIELQDFTLADKAKNQETLMADNTILQSEFERIEKAVLEIGIAGIELTHDELRLRKIIWLRHGCTGLYGDDEEMQCPTCGIDFKRDSVDLILMQFQITNCDEQLGYQS